MFFRRSGKNVCHVFSEKLEEYLVFFREAGKISRVFQRSHLRRVTHKSKKEELSKQMHAGDEITLLRQQQCALRLMLRMSEQERGEVKRQLETEVSLFFFLKRRSAL